MARLERMVGMIKHRLHRRAIALAVLAASLGVACSSKGTEPAADATQPTASSQAAVSLSGLAFTPATVNISAGGTVVWTDNEDVEHTVTAGTNEQPDPSTFDMVLTSGKTFSHTFSAPGTYSFFCRRHPLNMQGQVIVR